MHLDLFLCKMPGQDCESAQHGAIRQASYILLYVNDPSCLRIYSM